MALVSGLLRGSGVTINPNMTGLPGLTQLEHLVGALLTTGVIASIAGFGLSAIVWAVGNHSANPSLAGRGKSGVLVSAAAAMLVGGASLLANFFFNVGLSL